ncbi:MAG: hypothetical protein ACR2NF_02930, partial [Pirellulales bacterium]
GVGEASFLKLNGVGPGKNLAKNVVLFQVSDEFLLLDLEHPGYNIGAVKGSLARRKAFPNLNPIRVASHGDEEMGPSKALVECQSIKKLLMHVSVAAGEGRRKDDSFPSVLKRCCGGAIGFGCILQS